MKVKLQEGEPARLLAIVDPNTTTLKLYRFKPGVSMTIPDIEAQLITDKRFILLREEKQVKKKEINHTKKGDGTNGNR